MSKPSESSYEDYPICPYCGDVDRDAWELDLTDEQTYEHECPACDKVYMITCHVSIAYTSAAIAKAKGEGV